MNWETETSWTAAEQHNRNTQSADNNYEDAVSAADDDDDDYGLKPKRTRERRGVLVIYVEYVECGYSEKYY